MRKHADHYKGRVMTMPDGWYKSPIYCPECSGYCLTDGETLSCVECPFETTADSARGQKLIREYHAANGDDGRD